MASIYIRAPDHLGDGVMALPAIAALLSMGPADIEGPAWTQALYGTRSTQTPRAETAVLFKPSFSAAWRARRCRRRIGIRWDLRGPLLTDPVPLSNGHRVAQYAAIAAAAGATAHGMPSYTATATGPEIPDDAVVLLPLTKSTQTVAWRGFRALADALNGRAVFAAGPGEDARLAKIAGPHRMLPALDLPAFAGTVCNARFVVGNDSGLSHLAAAAVRGAEQSPAKVHVIYGSTDPARTGPPGTTAHHIAPLSCWPCYKKRCSVDNVAPCREIPVADVVRAMESM